jgi:hypothetical protein
VGKVPLVVGKVPGGSWLEQRRFGTVPVVAGQTRAREPVVVISRTGPA